MHDLWHSRNRQRHEDGRRFITERNVIRQNQTRRAAVIGDSG